ncbi:MAG: ABC transporter permease, partial [Candidatus Hodarchaeales archaeon]
HLRSSRKYIAISIFGLVFSLGLLASTFIYVDSSQGMILSEAINEFHQESPFELKEIDYSLVVNVTGNDFSSLRSVIQNELDTTIDNLGLRPKVEKNFIGTRVDGYGAVFNYQAPGSENHSAFTVVNVIKLTEPIKQELANFMEPGSQFPSSTEEAFLFSYRNSVEDEFITLDVNDEINISDAGIPTVLEKTLQITGVGRTLFPSVQKSYSLVSDKFEPPIYPEIGENFPRTQAAGVVLFVDDLEQFISSLQSVSTQSSARIVIYGYLKIDYTQLDVFSLSKEIDILDSLHVQFRDKMARAGYQNEFNSNFPSNLLLSHVMSNVQLFVFNLVLFIIPIIVVSLFVAQYAFGVIYKSIAHRIGTYKTRGASVHHVYLLLTVDFIIIVTLASVAAIFCVGIPLGSLIFHTDGFLSFNGNSGSDLVLNLDEHVQTLFIAGIILGIVLNFFRISRLGSMTIAESENPVDKGEPYWKKHNLDILFTIIGTIGYVFFYVSGKERLFDLGFFELIFLPFPLFLAVGVLFLISRAVPVVLLKVGSFLWQKTGSLLGFSLKNIVRHKQAATRGVMLIGVLMSFLVFFYSFPFSSMQYNNDMILHEMGAEGIGSSSQRDLNIDWNMLQDMRANYSDYFVVSPFIKLNFNDYGQEDFLAIDSSSFLEAASFSIAPNTVQPLNQVLDQLNQKNSPPGIIVFHRELTKRQAQPGDAILILNRHGSATYEVVDQFEFWPRLYVNAWSDLDLYGIIDLQAITLHDGILDESLFRISHVGYYFNFKEGIDKVEVKKWIAGNYSLDLLLAEEIQDKYLSSSSFLAELGVLNASIILSIIMAISIVLMFSFYQLIERRKEIVIETVLGMKMYQLSSQFLVESFVLLLTGMMVGNILGIVLTSMMSLFTIPGSSVMTMKLLIPWDLILGTQFLILIAATLGALIPAWLTTKQDVEGTFVAE